MAICTPPLSSRSYTTMHSTLSTVSNLPIELLSTWSEWRPNNSELPPTPPHSTMKVHNATPSSICSQTTLPSIAYLDRQAARQSPITPPQIDDSAQWHMYERAELKLPPIQTAQDYEPTYSVHCKDEPQPHVQSPPAPPALDWVETSTQRSYRFIAEKVAEMVCYLWFSDTPPLPLSSKRRRQSQDQNAGFPCSTASTGHLQFGVTHQFVHFVQKLLETTQVSQSVIVLSLRYIYRLKQQNRPYGVAGSEYRVVVTALMLANKFVDDNTYTNKTWSDVTGIPLEELNNMEREFLIGVEHYLYVDEATYHSWVNLLKGLILAKEKDSRRWHRTKPRSRCAHSRLTSSRVSSRARLPHPRARSISPSRTMATHAYSTPSAHVAHVFRSECAYPSPPRSCSKRTASVAFSPSPVPLVNLPKRPIGLSLQIPELSHTAPSTASSVSPAEPLPAFSRLSLGTSPASVRPQATQGNYSSPAHPTHPTYSSVVGHDQVPQTLVASYNADSRHSYEAPQQLYFYSLAGAPLEEDEDNNFRKARLRYHPAPVPSTYIPPPPQPAAPMVVQSATASPHDMHSNLPPITALPHFSEGFWNCPHPLAPPPPPAQSQHYRYPDQQCQSDGSVPAAPFANAGPPGIQFYANNVQQHLTPEQYWPRARQL